jgi:hypothetical protein
MVFLSVSFCFTALSARRPDSLFFGQFFFCHFGTILADTVLAIVEHFSAE